MVDTIFSPDYSSGSDPTSLSGSGSTLTGITSLSSTDEVRHPLPLLQSSVDAGLRESNGISNELLQDMFNMSLKAQKEGEKKKRERSNSSNSTPSSRSVRAPGEIGALTTILLTSDTLYRMLKLNFILVKSFAKTKSRPYTVNAALFLSRIQFFSKSKSIFSPPKFLNSFDWCLTFNHGLSLHSFLIECFFPSSLLFLIFSHW